MRHVPHVFFKTAGSRNPATVKRGRRGACRRMPPGSPPAGGQARRDRDQRVPPEVATITLDVSYAQIAVCGSSLESPFNEWTDKHVAQGFAWRPGRVSFRTLEESGRQMVTIVVAEPVGPVRPDAVRVIDVPFEVVADEASR